MRIDIDGLNEADLIDLNNRVVERLKFLRHVRAHSQMLEFSIGDRVSFQPEGRLLQVGMLTRYNKRTVTVITESGEHWNVAPGLLRRVNSSQRPTRRPLCHGSKPVHHIRLAFFKSLTNYPGRLGFGKPLSRV